LVKLLFMSETRPGPIESERPKKFASYGREKFLASTEWQPAHRAFFGRHHEKRRIMEWRRADDVFCVGYEWEENVETINELHGENFLDEVIPKIIAKLRARGSKRKVRILDMGCGLGFFTDQIRARFGNEVEVYGTGIGKASLKRRKANIFRDIESGAIPLDPEQKARILSESDGSLHPNDAICNSVEQMRDFPEFDLIIDSEGEIVYAGGNGAGFYPKADTTQTKLICAIKKLNPGGELFISRIHFHHKNLTPERRAEISREYGVIIEDNEKAFQPGALKVTKLGITK
jgi:SAM-dependent methyltransferase